MRAALIVAATDLRRRLRNRSALVTAVVGPLALAIVFGLLVQGAESASFRLGVVDADRSAISRGVVASLFGDLGSQARDVLRFERVAGVEEARRRVDDGSLDAAIVVPSGYGAATAAGRAPALRVLRSPDRVVSGRVGESVALGIASHVDQVSLSVRLAAALGAKPSQALVAAAGGAPAAIALGELERGGSEADATAFYGASMSILFLFFTVGFASRSLIAERAGGTLPRMLAAGVPPEAVVAGKVMAVSTLAFGGFALVWAVTSLAFGAGWGDPLAVVVLMAATVFAIGGVSTLVASFGRTEQQADAYTGAVTFALALLGGNFVGPGAAPDLLQTLSLATPNGWALRGFTDLSADGGSVPSMWLPLLVLVAIGTAFWAVGLARVYRTVLR